MKTEAKSNDKYMLQIRKKFFIYMTKKFIFTYFFFNFAAKFKNHFL